MEPVVVVGAGLAGLRAATVLRAAGTPVVVLEARRFAGGRVQTLRAPFDEELYGEAGAVRIPPIHRRVRRLVEEHGLEIVPFVSTNGSTLVRVAGVTVRPAGLKDLAQALDLRPDEAGLSQGALLQRYVTGLPADLGDLAPTAETYRTWRKLDQMSWPAWLRSRGASPGAVTLMTLGGDSRELSALYVLRQFVLLEQTTQSYKIRGGMDRLPRAMAASLGDSVRYHTSVVRIDQASESVRLDCLERGRPVTVRASRVIVTAPFPLVRRIGVRPALSQRKQQAVDGVPYFPAVRVLLQTRDRFWHASDLSASARTDQPAEIWDCSYDLPAERGLLGMTVGGEIGRRMEGMARGDAVALGVDLAAQVLPGLHKAFEKGAVYRWASDPWSRGAFAVFHPGEMASMMPETARAEGRLHFAGEHTSPWTGWMEGALESGERAAHEVLTA